MSTITNIPIVLDPVLFPDPGWADNLFAGPYFVNGKLYTVQKNRSFNSSPWIYSSTDGITWTQIQIIDSAASSITSIWFWDPLGPNPSVITFAVRTAVLLATFYLVDYDCATETLGSPYGVSGGPHIDNTSQKFYISRLSNGDINFFSINNPKLNYSHYDQGTDTWTAVDVLVFDATGAGFQAFSLRCLSACTDRTADGSAVLFRYADNTGNAHWWYRYLDSSLVLGTAQEFNFSFPTNVNTTMDRMYQGSDDKIYISELTCQDGPASGVGVGIWVLSGADLSAPTMTETVIHNFSPGSENVATIFTFANEFNSRPCVLVTLATEQSGHGSSQYNVYIYRFTYDGASWSIPELFIDLVTYPPTTPPPAVVFSPFYYLEGLTWIQSDSSQGDIGILISLSCASVGAPAFALVSPPPPVTIGIACPANTIIPVGVPYYAQIEVSGGTPPYTFAIVGGALPTGITLDPSTGILSGTTNDPVGSYSYTVEVTDANMDTAQITCGLEVGCPGIRSLMPLDTPDPKLTEPGGGGTTLRSLL